MSIELRLSDEYGVVCDWGVIEHGDPRPDEGQVGHLMLATRDYVRELTHCPQTADHGALHSVAAVDDRLFAYSDYDGKRWTWELFEAHWWDGGGPEIYVGRWPD